MWANPCDVNKLEDVKLASKGSDPCFQEFMAGPSGWEHVLERFEESGWGGTGALWNR